MRKTKKNMTQKVKLEKNPFEAGEGKDQKKNGNFDKEKKRD